MTRDKSRELALVVFSRNRLYGFHTGGLQFVYQRKSLITPYVNVVPATIPRIAGFLNRPFYRLVASERVVDDAAHTLFFTGFPQRTDHSRRARNEIARTVTVELYLGIKCFIDFIRSMRVDNLN